MRLAELEQRFLSMCLSQEVPSELGALASEAEQKRLLLYRDMVRWRFHHLAGDVLTRSKAAMGAEAFDAAIDRWIASPGPRSRFFRDLPLEIADHLLAEPVSPLVADVLRLERARWSANIAPDASETVVPFALEAVPVPSPSLVIFEADHAVHAAALQGPGDQRPQRMHYAVYRKPDLSVTTRWSSATLAALLRGWAEGKVPAIETVRAVLAAEGREPTSAFVEEMTTYLAALLEDGALLGSRP